MLDSHSFDLSQEQWLFDHLKELGFIKLDFLLVEVSGMDSSVLLHGQPFGGCAILF